jgi:hypothetical protein
MKKIILLTLLALGSHVRAAEIIPAKRTTIIVGGGSDATKLPLAGGTMTGNISFSSAGYPGFSMTKDPTFDLGILHIFTPNPTAEGSAVVFSSAQSFDPATVAVINFSTSNGLSVDGGRGGSLELSSDQAALSTIGGGFFTLLSSSITMNGSRANLQTTGGTFDILSDVAVRLANLAGGGASAVYVDPGSVTVRGAEINFQTSPASGDIYWSAANMFANLTQTYIGRGVANWGELLIQASSAAMKINSSTNRIEVTPAKVQLTAPLVDMNTSGGTVQISAATLNLAAVPTIIIPGTSGRALCRNGSGAISNCTSPVGVGGTCTCP